MTDASAVHLRRADPDDLPFLWQMLGAASAPLGPPTASEVLQATPELARYLAGWGRVGDTGLVAVDHRTGPVGACWYRLFTGDEPGYGFVDDVTPELAIACVRSARGQGLGHRLVRGLLDLARDEGHARLSLSVLIANPVAIRVYEDCGFETVGRGPDGDDVVMVAPTRR